MRIIPLSLEGDIGCTRRLRRIGKYPCEILWETCSFHPHVFRSLPKSYPINPLLKPKTGGCGFCTQKGNGGTMVSFLRGLQFSAYRGSSKYMDTLLRWTSTCKHLSKNMKEGDDLHTYAAFWMNLWECMPDFGLRLGVTGWAWVQSSAYGSGHHWASLLSLVVSSS